MKTSENRLIISLLVLTCENLGKLSANLSKPLSILKLQLSRKRGEMPKTERFK